MRPQVARLVTQTTQIFSARRAYSNTPPTKLPRTIFSGIQPTGVPHIGNYLGALRQWVKLQNDAAPDTRLIYSIVNAHAITVPHDEEQLKTWKRETLGTLLAIGLDPERSIIYFQSDVKAHFELHWILSCVASSMGYLQRMTQWKYLQSKMSLPDDASLADTSNKELKLGLFSYPVLQAADILLHRATHVPVGEDQEQHLEFARRCARMFNSGKNDLLPIPQTILSTARRIMSLSQPHLKMSKSHPDPKSRILITDTYDDIKQKIRLTVTDSEQRLSYDPVTRPGVSNLLDIMSSFGDDREDPLALAKRLDGLSMRQFKEEIVETIENGLAPIRSNYEDIMAVEGGKYVDHIATQGATKARQNAEDTMIILREAVAF